MMLAEPEKNASS